MGFEWIVIFIVVVPVCLTVLMVMRLFGKKKKVGKAVAQFQRFFAIIIGILAMLPIIYPPTSDVKGYYPFSLFGLASLGAYVFALIFLKRKIAGVCFLCCAAYFFLSDLSYKLFIPTNSVGLACVIGSVLRFLFEALILVQGYFGLVALEKEKTQTDVLSDE